MPIGCSDVDGMNGWVSGRNEVGVDLYDGADGAGEWWRVIEGVEKIGVPDGGGGGGMFRGKSRPCLNRFWMMAMYDGDVKGGWDRYDRDKRCIRFSNAVVEESLSTEFFSKCSGFYTG